MRPASTFCVMKLLKTRVKIVNISDFLGNVWYNFPIDKFQLSVSDGNEWKSDG